MENFSWPAALACLFAGITLALKIVETDVTTWRRLGQWMARAKWPVVTVFVLIGICNSLLGIGIFWLDRAPLSRSDVLGLLLHVGVLMLLPKFWLDEFVEKRASKRATKDVSTTESNVET